jgi:pimeloyl-ACP methyl ester carboxylesterase
MYLRLKLAHVTVWLWLLGSCGQPAAAQEGRVGPPPELANLVTKDGIQLKATYFPGSARSGSPQAKQTTPVILLHDFKSSRAAFAPLIATLQSGGGEAGGNGPSFAVMAVDLRAHGESVTQQLPDGSQAALDASKLSKEGLAAMVALDMEAVRSFLVDKNDAGELNLNKLCLVGSGMGASVATNWAARDWAAPPLAIGKQGQDVKALVLISPRWSYNGLSMQDAMRFAPLKQNVAWLMICGAQDPKVKTDLDRIQKLLARFHPETDKKSGQQKPSGLEVNMLPSSLQGDILLGQSGQVINTEILKFLTENVAAREQPWINRRNRIP